MTTVVPTAKLLPELWLLVKLLIEQLSFAVGSVQETLAAQVFAAALTAIFDGQPDMVGGTASLTVTVAVPAKPPAVQPLASSTETRE